MRIRRHDALVNIIYNALSQDHPGVLKEQRASYDDGLRPGDVFHPDFQHGRPAYFDVSIHCTTQPAFISSCASCAEVAAAAGEVAKDDKHLAAVEKVGSDFVPLVVETFGVWTPFALKTLQNIADLVLPCLALPCLACLALPCLACLPCLATFFSSDECLPSAHCHFFYLQLNDPLLGNHIKALIFHINTVLKECI